MVSVVVGSAGAIVTRVVVVALTVGTTRGDGVRRTVAGARAAGRAGVGRRHLCEVVVL